MQPSDVNRLPLPTNRLQFHSSRGGPNPYPTHRRRQILSLALLATAYALVQLPAVREWYAPWDKLAHAGAFVGVAALLRWCLPWPLWRRALLALALGAAVELHQALLPGFTPSFADWLADAAGLALAAGVEAFLTRRRVH